MIRETHKKAVLPARPATFRRLRAWVLGLCLAAGALLASRLPPSRCFKEFRRRPLAWHRRLLNETVVASGTWYVSGGSIDLDNITADYFFISADFVVLAGICRYQFSEQSNGHDHVLLPRLFECAFGRHHRNGIRATIYWSFYAPSALLTNSSAYANRYTRTQHDGAVSTYVNPLPTGTVTIVFFNVVNTPSRPTRQWRWPAPVHRK